MEDEGRVKLIDIHEGKFLAMAQSDAKPDHWYEVVGYYDTGAVVCNCPDCICRDKKGDLALWQMENALGGCKHIVRVLRFIEAENALIAIEGACLL